LQSSFLSRHRDHLIFIAHRATTLIIFVFTPSRSSSLLHCALISSLRHQALHSLCLWAFCFSVHCCAVDVARSFYRRAVKITRPVDRRTVEAALSVSSRAIEVMCSSS
jgi:hypothetical protein